MEIESNWIELTRNKDKEDKNCFTTIASKLRKLIVSQKQTRKKNNLNKHGLRSFARSIFAVAKQTTFIIREKWMRDNDDEDDDLRALLVIGIYNNFKIQ